MVQTWRKQNSFLQYAKIHIRMEEGKKMESPGALKNEYFKQIFLGTNLNDWMDPAETGFFYSLVSLEHRSQISSV